MKLHALLLALLTTLGASALFAEGPTEITSGQMSLKFTAEGKPKSFKVGDKELLNERNPGVGFEIQGFAYNYGNPSTLHIKDLNYDGNALVASIGANLRVTLEVKKSDRYIAFMISRVEGLPLKNRLGLRFNMNVADTVKVLPLDAATQTSARGCDIRWPWLWMRSDTVPMGSFALYDSATEQDAAALFMHICQTENLAKSADLKGEWTLESARRFFTARQAQWADSNLAELKAASSPSTGPAAEIISKKIQLKFSPAGKPVSFIINGSESINAKDPGAGFELCGYDYAEGKRLSFPLNHLHYDGKQLTASNGRKAKVVFDVAATDRYLTFKIKSLEGISKESRLWLQFRMNTSAKTKALALDYMCGVAKQGNSIAINWNWLWDDSAGNPLGGFALYAPTSGADEDETLLHLWANAGLPHPKVKGAWNLETARKWLADWQSQFADVSKMVISAKTNAELYALADYASTMDIKRLYMHTDTWRGEYWPNKYSFLHLNPATFPNGEEDFQKFARYARSKGLGLTIHDVSCSIGNHDPDYVAAKIDPRLAKWVQGTLAQAASETDKTIYFKPNPGEEMVLTADRNVTGPSQTSPQNNINTICIDNELIEVGQFTDTDKEIWILKNCRRGHLKSTPASHAIKAPLTGLIRPYGQVFTANNDTSLVEEIGRRMAEFYNRNNIVHCIQDSAESHTVNHPWGYAKFAQAVYTNLDHPTTSNNSGGTPMPCHFEYQFNSSKKAMRTSADSDDSLPDSRDEPASLTPTERNGLTIPLTVARNGRPATSPYELFSLVGKPVASGLRSIGLYKPEPMFGVTLETLRNQGLAAYATEVVSTWKQVGPLLTEAQRKAILSSSDQVIFRAAKGKGQLSITPLRMLSRPGIDIDWREGSEFGPIVPRQYVKTGDSLEVENPYADQEPEFIIRVMNAFDVSPNAALRNSGQTVSRNKDSQTIDSYNIGAGIDATEGGKPAVKTPISPTIDIQPLAEKIKNKGDHTFTQEGNAIRIQFKNKRNEAVTNTEKLPNWTCASDMTQARGIGLTVNGDGSGALLIIQPNSRGRRDYIVPLDFKGERNIIIPCGEAAWADVRWGWKMETKGSQYGELKKVSMAIGKVPPKTHVDIKISNLRVLPEIPTEVTNPTVNINSGSMQITGKVSSDSYLWFQGGDTVGVYDLNWKKISDLAVKKQKFIAPKGFVKLSMEYKDIEPAPWLEWQFFVKDSPMILEVKK
jgi:hypothetical protein